MAEGQDARVQEIREWATRALAEKSAADMPLAVAGDTVFLLARLDALTAERDELLIVSRECRESMSRATTAMARDVVTINDLKARLAAAESALERVGRLLSEWGEAAIAPKRRRRVIEARDIAIAALAGSREHAAGEGA